MKHGRGRPRKEHAPHLVEIVANIRNAYVNENKDALFKHLMALKQSKTESYQSENLDQILSQAYKLKTTKKDSERSRSDEEIVKEYYRQHPEIFNFNSLEDYKFKTWIEGNAMVELLEMAEELPEDTEQITFSDGSKHYIVDLAEHIESAIHRSEKDKGDTANYSTCLDLGIPREQDIVNILDHAELNQKMKEGDAMAKRLRKRRKEYEVEMEKQKEELEQQRELDPPII